MYLLIYVLLTLGRVTFSGVVIDSETQNPLELAHIRILGTNIGTVTNEKGQFELQLERGKYHVLVSFMGYKPETLILDLKEPVSKRILLKKTVLFLNEVIVHPGGPTPAKDLIRKAQRKKWEVLKGLKNFRFDAYTKTVFKLIKDHDGFSDTSIVGIMETVSEGYWSNPDNYKEIVIAKRETANFPHELNFSFAMEIPDFNRERVRVMDYSVPGPTSSVALRYYDFQIVDTLLREGKKIVRLKINPRKDLFPLFEGTVDIDDDNYIVTGVDLKANRALLEPPLKFFSIREDFSLYLQKFWLPINVKIVFVADLPFGFSNLGKVVVEKTSVITNYEINKPEFDVVFDENIIEERSEAKDIDSLTWSRFQRIPLTLKEREFYHLMDSLSKHLSLKEKIFSLIIRGPLFTRKLPITEFSDFFHFNRVEGAYVGAGLKLNGPMKTSYEIKGGYGLSDRRWKYCLGFSGYLDKRERFSIGGGIFNRISKREDPEIFTQNSITLSALLYKKDYWDYFLDRGFEVYALIKPVFPSRFKINYNDERLIGTTKNTDFSLLYRKRRFRENPTMDRGHIRSIKGIFIADNRRFIDLGFFRLVDRSRDFYRLKLAFEYSGGNYLRSDYDFGSLDLSLLLYLHLPIPAGLIFYGKIGTLLGNPPNERYFEVETSNGGLAPIGALRTAKVNEFVGKSIILSSLSIDLGTLPFRFLKLSYLERSGIGFVPYLGFGFAEKSFYRIFPPLGGKSKSSLFEGGFSFDGILGFLRVDFTWRLTNRIENNFFVSLGTSL